MSFAIYDKVDIVFVTAVGCIDDSGCMDDNGGLHNSGDEHSDCGARSGCGTCSDGDIGMDKGSDDDIGTEKGSNGVCFSTDGAASGVSAAGFSHTAGFFSFAISLST